MTNNIKWIFEKIFNQLTNNTKDLFEIPYHLIREKTFNNNKIYSIIGTLTLQSVEDIKQTIINYEYHFLFKILKNKANINILLGTNYQSLKKPSLILAVINNRLDIIKNYSIDDIELLAYAAQYGYEDIYFYLRQFLSPIIVVYKKAIYGNNLNIIKDVSNVVGLSTHLLELAFEENNSDVILFLIDIAKEENIKINNNLLNYLVMNNNLELINKIEYLFEWSIEIYYSALLSGSMEMIKFVETKINIDHTKKELDMSKIEKGKKSLLLDDIIYIDNGKKYFSHTMNYAIQSNNLEIVKYINQLGYGITMTNLITAIRQADVDIFEFISLNFNKIPLYIINYFSHRSFIVDKFEKAKLIFDKIDWYHHYSVDDYRKEKAHIEIINNNNKIDGDNIYDIDYLMKYYLFFDDIYLRLVTSIRLHLLFNKIFTHKNIQIISDVIFLFGNIQQLKEVIVLPKIEIIMEVLCYQKIIKICYLIQKQLLEESDKKQIFNLGIILNNQNINLVLDKFFKYDKNIKYIILSEDIELIKNIIHLVNNKDDIQNILLLENNQLNLLLKIDNDIKDWCRDNDL